jgi:prefoldin alpha subunit
MAKEKKNQENKNNETQEKPSQAKEVKLTGNQIAEMLNSEKAKFNAIMQRISELQSAMIETKGSINALKELSKQKNAKTLIPLGAGVFMEAGIENSENVKITLPGNVIVQKSNEEAVKELEKQAEALSNEINALQKEQQQTAINAGNLENIIRTAQAQMRKQKA